VIQDTHASVVCAGVRVAYQACLEHHWLVNGEIFVGGIFLGLIVLAIIIARSK